MAHKQAAMPKPAVQTTLEVYYPRHGSFAEPGTKVETSSDTEAATPRALRE